MSNIRFTWDSAKATQNRRKHGVSFEEAQSVFYDDYAQLTPDPDHSKEEDRFILLSSQMRLLIVCHCYRESDSVIRIISARKATKKEQRSYPG